MVSVIVPVYNVGPYLRECVDSILDQTYRELEVILVDDGSRDGSGALCDEYAEQDKRVTVVHKENGGLTSARNAGLQIARGEWIMHVDGDDYINSDMVSDMIAKAENTGADMVIGGLRLFWDNKARIHDVQPTEWTDDKISSLNRYIGSDWTCLCGTVARRELYLQNNITSPEGITWYEDFYVMARLTYFAKKVTTLYYPYYCYRQRAESIMGTWSEAMEKSAEAVILSTIDFYKTHSVFAPLSKVLSWRLLNVMQGLILDEKRYADLRSIASTYRQYIFGCPYLSCKRKVLYWLHSYGMVEKIGLKR